MLLSRMPLCLALLILITLTACGIAPGAAPTLTPDPALPATAAALFPGPVSTAAPTPTPVAERSAAEAIARLLGEMQSAIFTRNVAAYLALVDLEADPTFGLEHTRWVEDWHSGPANILQFALSVRNLTLSDTGDEAVGDLNITWSTLGDVRISRGADYPVRFTRDAAGQWRYAGEYFALSATTPHFDVRAMAGLDAELAEVAGYLPDVYVRVTAALDHTPAGRQVIKLYANPWALVATTRLSLTQPISGWNEPGEALKLVGAAARDEITLAHEFAHYITFDLAGTTRGGYPWWVAEGLAEFAASAFWTGADRLARIAAVQERRRSAGLVDWDALAVFEETPESLWPYAYQQGYAFVRFVEDTYGAAARHTWVRAMAAGDTLEAATQAAFGVSFQEANTAFLAWLDEQ